MPNHNYALKVDLPQDWFDEPSFAAFIFMDTNFLAYGYAPVDVRPKSMEALALRGAFESQGWKDDTAGDVFLKYLSDALTEFKGAAYIFVVGHHPMSCPEGRLREMDELMRTQRVTAYLYGHIHELEYSFYEPSNTMYVLSGAGSHNSHRRNYCTKVRRDTEIKYRLFGKLGFAMGNLNKDGFRVAYFDESANKTFESDVVKSRLGK